MIERELVFVCSPLSPELPPGFMHDHVTEEDIKLELNRRFEENIRKAEAFCRHLYLTQNVMPLAPHVYFTRFLDDMSPEERRAGMEMGRQLLKLCNRVAVDAHTGKVTRGMADELADAHYLHKPIESRDRQTEEVVDAYIASLLDHFGG